MRNDRGISRIVIEPDNCNQCFSTMLDRLWLVSPDRVSIDVKPGAEKSVFAADSNAKVSLAILSTACFNAATAVDRTSLTFGRQGTEASILGCSASDVNRDSIPDLDCQFSARAGAFVRGDLVAKLRGRLLSGESIYGSGEVIVK